MNDLTASNDPVSDFIMDKWDASVTTYSAGEFAGLVVLAAQSRGMTRDELRTELQSAGLHMDQSKFVRPHNPETHRGYRSGGGCIWADPSMQSHGGCGIDPTTGSAGKSGPSPGFRWDPNDPRCLRR